MKLCDILKVYRVHLLNMCHELEDDEGAALKLYRKGHYTVIEPVYVKSLTYYWAQTLTLIEEERNEGDNQSTSLNASSEMVMVTAGKDPHNF